MILLDLLAKACSAQYLFTSKIDRFTAFASDSREAADGDLFAAVRGVHSDGADYIREAVVNGASGVLLDFARLQKDPDLQAWLIGRKIAIIAVEDTRIALQAYADAVLREWKPKIIAVAGSAGKTTVKEALAVALGAKNQVFHSWKNYNDLLGMPLSLGRLEPQHETAVIEIASDYPGEAEILAKIVQPDLGVILNAAPMRLDTLLDESGIGAALCAILPYAKITFAPTHSPTLRHAITDKQSQYLPNVRWFDDPQRLERWRLIEPQNEHLVMQIDGEIRHFRRLHGLHWQNDIMATLAVCEFFNIPAAEAAESLEYFLPLPGRMRVINGLRQSLLLDDSHNAIPLSLNAALQELSRQGTIRQKPRIAVIGAMTHLGAQSDFFHAEAGTTAAECCDWLITRGEAAIPLARKAISQGMDPQKVIVTTTLTDTWQAAQSIAETCAAAPIILIKGSPEMKMEEVTAKLLNTPELTEQLLDRRRTIWRKAIAQTPERPTWIEIDLDAIAGNTRAIKQIIGPTTEIMATLKADAYGHGALRTAWTALRNGAAWLGTAAVSEAVVLRNAGVTAPILVYGFVPVWQAEEALRNNLSITLYSLELAQALSRAAQSLGANARVHVKIDTGMGRLGLRYEHTDDILAFLRLIQDLPGIIIEGIFTHFASADEEDLTFTYTQLQRFNAILTAAEQAGIHIPIRHAANSAALLRVPEARMNLVRPGIILYGLAPSEHVTLPPEFRPAMTFKTQIAMIKTVAAGEPVSYGRTYITENDERIATLPVGYADGFRRGPFHWGYTLIHGKRAPIRGRVCMDQVMVSVDTIPEAKEGDEVILIGEQMGEAITVEDIARELHTSGYEVVSTLLARIPRMNG